MDNIITFKNKTPKIDKGAYINPFAIVIGEVEIHAGVSLWPGVIVRADEESIVIGENSALLDRTLVETPSTHPVTVGENVLISHNVTLHGCKIHDNVLIGIGANILDGAEIGSGSVIGAGALISPGINIPSRSKVTGVPGKITGEVTESELEEIKLKHSKITDKAREYGDWFVTGQI